MTRLVERVAKAILAQNGVAVPEWRLCRNPDEVASACEFLGPGCYLKAQIPIGDRAAIGAVMQVDRVEEAVATTAAWFKAGVASHDVESVLVERAVNGSDSAYAAVQVSDEGPAELLLFSSSGGSGFDPREADLRISLPPRDLETFEIRKHLRRIGMTGSRLNRTGRLLEVLIRCARDWHAYSLEINPIAYIDDMPVAIDAKIEIDDHAVELVPDMSRVSLGDLQGREAQADKIQRDDHRGTLRYVQLIPEAHDRLAGYVGSHSVGGGESMVVMDALAEAGLRPTNYCDTSGSPSQEKVRAAAELVGSQQHISGLFFSSCIANQPLSVTAMGLVEGLSNVGWALPAVFRFAGNQEAEACEIVRDWASTISAPIEVCGRDESEWDAARRLRALLPTGGESNGVPD